MVNITFLPKICIVGRNTFIHCSWIAVAHVNVNIFVYNSPSIPLGRKWNQKCLLLSTQILGV